MVGCGSTVSVAVAPLRKAAMAGSEGGRLFTPAGATTVRSFGGVILFATLALYLVIAVQH